MIIAGLQKLTLIDYPDKIACSIFLHGCDFRCGFCHNPGLVIQPASKTYSEQEILDFLEKRRRYLDGVCITGGEPLLSVDEAFLKKIKDLGYFIKLDTNGSLPLRLKELIDSQLVDYVAMDIKASKESYDKVAGIKVDLKKIEESIGIISTMPDYEFRTTFVKRYHDEKEIRKIAEWLNQVAGKKPRKYCLQGFRNSGGFIDESFKAEPDADKGLLLSVKENIKDQFEEVCVRA